MIQVVINHLISNIINISSHIKITNNNNNNQNNNHHNNNHIKNNNNNNNYNRKMLNNWLKKIKRYQNTNK